MAEEAAAASTAIICPSFIARQHTALGKYSNQARQAVQA